MDIFKKIFKSLSKQIEFYGNDQLQSFINVRLKPTITNFNNINL